MTDISIKRTAFREKILTNHDPCRVKTFPAYPKFYKPAVKAEGMKMLKPNNAVLTNLGQKLAGF